MQLLIVFNPGKVTIGVLGEWFIDPGYQSLTQFIWNDFDKFRTGPIGPLLLLVQRASGVS